MVTVILYMVMSVFLNNDLGEGGSGSLRPLVHDEDCSDSEANEDVEAGLAQKDGSTEPEMSVSKFGI